jgi:hypothetical protein
MHHYRQDEMFTDKTCFCVNFLCFFFVSLGLATNTEKALMPKINATKNNLKKQGIDTPESWHIYFVF